VLLRHTLPEFQVPSSIFNFYFGRYWPFELAWKLKKISAPHLYGLEGYVGLAGQGKTMAVCKRLMDIRKQYGDDVLIATNFGFENEDFPLTDWREILVPRDKCFVVVLDELPNLFNSRKYKDFPMELVMQLTQMRKGHGVLLLYTAQRFFLIEKTFRELSFAIHECRCWFGCFNVVSTYDPMDYNDLLSKSDVNQKMRIKPKRTTFVQTDELRNCYDSYQFLESALKVLNGENDLSIPEKKMPKHEISSLVVCDQKQIDAIVAQADDFLARMKAPE